MNKIEATNVLKEFIETYIKSHGEEDVITVQLDNVDVEAFGTIVKELEKETVARESYEHEYFLRKEFELKIAKVESILARIEEEINSSNRGTCDYFIVDRIEEIIDKYKTEMESE